MGKTDLRAAKEAANTRYADRFRKGKTSPKHLRKKKRRERTLDREKRFLRESGIERDDRWPLA